MSSAFLNQLEEDLKVPLFTDSDLSLIFPDKDPAAIYNSLTYYVKKGNVVRLRRGLYSLAKKKGEGYRFSKFQLANHLVLHSYVSFESALSHHNLIPEAVYEVTSASLVKNVEFENSLGRFSFSCTPVVPFYLGVEKDEATRGKIANPVRALFDLICVRRKLYETVADLEADLRVDLSELKHQLGYFAPEEVRDLAERYKKRSTRLLAKVLIEELM